MNEEHKGDLFHRTQGSIITIKRQVRKKTLWEEAGREMRDGETVIDPVALRVKATAVRVEALERRIENLETLVADLRKTLAVVLDLCEEFGRRTSHWRQEERP